MLGLTLDNQSPHWTDFLVGGVRIGLHPPFAETVESTNAGWILCLQVTDIRALRSKLIDSAVTVSNYHDTPAGAILDFCDPDGHSLQAIQPGVFIKDLV